MSEVEPPKSPTLLPPRKSVELQDAGAHELDSSEDEVFADARESIISPTRLSRVPTTRVEKVDDVPSHGQVPGTAAYEMRIHDAVPDEVAIVPEGTTSRPTSRRKSQAGFSPGGSPIPKTVVERVDDSPSHGEVPGTDAHAKRLADAVPDSIIKAQEEAMKSTSASGGIVSPGSPVPKMIVTKVDSRPSHGEVPGTEAYRKRVQDAVPDLIEKSEENPSKQLSSQLRFIGNNLNGHETNIPSRSSYFNSVSRPRPSASPIAADGGFGPMDYEEDSDDENTSGRVTRDESTARNATDNSMNDSNDDFGDDFDDFEEGTEGGEDDFSDFSGGFVQAQPEPKSIQTPKQSTISAIPTFPVLDFSGPQNLSDIISSTEDQLSCLFPSTTPGVSSTPPQVPDSSTFLTDRSLSLWSQLVAPPPLQPRNWVQSRIRRLFLVSLGVPVDLDEILPKSKQNKLVLNYTSTPSDPTPQGAAARLRNDADNGSDSTASNPSSSKTGVKKSRRKGPAPPPDFNIDAVKKLCETTDKTLEGLSKDELRTHIKKLEELVERGKEVLQYWIRRKEAAVGEKEAFDGVIENLVRHARKVRK